MLLLELSPPGAGERGTGTQAQAETLVVGRGRSPLPIRQRAAPGGRAHLSQINSTQLLTEGVVEASGSPLNPGKMNEAQRKARGGE